MSGRKRRAANSTLDSREFIHIRIPSADLRTRFKSMAAGAGLSYWEYLTHLLDKEQSRLTRQRAQMASPLHRPPPENLDPGELWRSETS